MAQSTIPSSEDHRTLIEALEEHPIIRWVSTHGRTLFWGFLLFVVLVIIGIRLMTHRTHITEADKGSARNAALLLQTGDLSSDKVIAQAVDSLQQAVRQDSALQKNYGGVLAQWLLNSGKDSEAKPLAAAAIARSKSENAPFYTEFSETTLAMIGGQNVLPQVEQLQKQMNEAVDPDAQRLGPSLYAYNSLREVVLLLKSGDRSAAAKQWLAWKEEAKRSFDDRKIPGAGYEQVASAFQIGELGLVEWLDEVLAAAPKS